MINRGKTLTCCSSTEQIAENQTVLYHMKTPEKIYLEDYTPPPFFIDQADLIFDIQDDQTLITSKLLMRKNNEVTDNYTPLVLDKGAYTIVSVIAGGMLLMPGEYEEDDQFFKLANTPDKFELEISSILKPQENTTLEGLYNPEISSAPSAKPRDSEKSPLFWTGPMLWRFFHVPLLQTGKNTLICFQMVIL